MCVFKPKQGSDKVDVLSQVDNRKECKMGVGWCCCKGVLSPEAGIGSWICHVALDMSLFCGIGWESEKGVPHAKNHARNFTCIISFLFCERKKHRLREHVNCLEFLRRKPFALVELK